MVAKLEESSRSLKSTKKGEHTEGSVVANKAQALIQVGANRPMTDSDKSVRKTSHIKFDADTGKTPPVGPAATPRSPKDNGDKCVRSSKSGVVGNPSTPSGSTLVSTPKAQSVSSRRSNSTSRTKSDASSTPVSHKESSFESSPSRLEQQKATSAPNMKNTGSSRSKSPTSVSGEKASPASQTRAKAAQTAKAAISEGQSSLRRSRPIMGMGQSKAGVSFASGKSGREDAAGEIAGDAERIELPDVNDKEEEGPLVMPPLVQDMNGTSALKERMKKQRGMLRWNAGPSNTAAIPFLQNGFKSASKSAQTPYCSLRHSTLGQATSGALPKIGSGGADMTATQRVRMGELDPGESPKCTCFAAEKREYFKLQGESCSRCGRPESDACHSQQHTCMHCGEAFTAVTNSNPSCYHHSGVVRRLGTDWYAWTCCLQRPHEAKTVKEFKELQIPHVGYHVS